MVGTWQTNYSLNSDKFAPLEKAVLENATIQNLSKDQLVVTKVFVEFDCQEGITYSVKCNIPIESNEKKIIPKIEFTIPLGMPTGAQRYRFGAETRQFIKEEWEVKSSFVAKGKFVEIRQLLPRDFKVFISHSNSKDDNSLINACREALVTCGLTGYFAEADNKAGRILWDKIFLEISHCDAFLVLWTKSASKSGDVREEIGMALGCEKTIIPVVQNNVNVYGSLKSRGVEWIPYQPDDEITALSEALAIIMDYARIKEERKTIIEAIPKKKVVSRAKTRKIKK
jgi:hypothetical protein